MITYEKNHIMNLLEYCSKNYSFNYSTFGIIVIMLLSSMDLFSQIDKSDVVGYFIKLEKTSSHYQIKTDSCDNILEIAMSVNRPDCDYFQILYYPRYDEGVFFNGHQSKFYLRKEKATNIVDYKWFYRSETGKKIAYSEIDTKLYFIEDCEDDNFYIVYDAGILFSVE